VEPRVTYEPTRAGEVTKYLADLTKARALLGYQPTFPLTAGLKLAVAWQRETGRLPP
jgi:nucleoside-diphosphate-sugar epimerase